MHPFLCFADLALNADNSAEGKETNAVVDSSTAEAAAGEICQLPIALFVREKNKKSSFVLEQPFALFRAFVNEKLQKGDAVPKLSQSPNNDSADEIDAEAFDLDEQQNVEPSSSSIEQLAGDGKPANGGEKTTISATASITSCLSVESPKSLEARETFVFGGLELIANVKTVEVYISKTSKLEEESYLTTCKGIPMRDLPGLAEIPPYINGGRADGESKTTDNRDGNRYKSKGSIEAVVPVEGIAKTEEHFMFYKFILVSPGGPKPLKRVRLKFVKSDASCVHMESVIVRTLKVKGRLSDSIPSSRVSQTTAPQPSFPVGTPNFSPGILNNQTSMMAMMGGNGMMRMPSQNSTPQPSLPVGPANLSSGSNRKEQNDNVNNLASMMAMMGGNGMMGRSMAVQQQQTQQLQVQPSHQHDAQQQQQQQQISHQQEKNQAEIMSSVAGLGIFLKASEERALNKLETMLTDMEMRIMKRLDGLSERLDAIEQSISESNNELDEIEPSVNQSNDELSSQE